MAYLTIIAAIGQNKELGYKNALIWSLPNDLRFFKKQTEHKKIVMGYNTFLSLPKLLPNRKHIVLTSHKILHPEVLCFSSFNDLFNYLNSLSEEVMIIGGASIYQLFLPYSQELLLTLIQQQALAATFFPNFNEALYEKQFLDEQNENGITYQHVRYLKKSS